MLGKPQLISGLWSPRIRDGMIRQINPIYPLFVVVEDQYQAQQEITKSFDRLRIPLSNLALITCQTHAQITPDGIQAGSNDVVDLVKASTETGHETVLILDLVLNGIEVGDKSLNALMIVKRLPQLLTPAHKTFFQVILHSRLDIDQQMIPTASGSEMQYDIARTLTYNQFHWGIAHKPPESEYLSPDLIKRLAEYSIYDP